MERDTNKRKLTQESPNEGLNTKYRKIYSQMTNNRSSTQGSAVTEKILSLWKTGSGLVSGATQEGTDTVKLRELEIKYQEADKIIRSIKKKLILSEENVTELNILVKKETTEKQSLLNKMSMAWDLIADISQHINYITESLNRFQSQTSILSDKYNNVIEKLRTENVALKTELKQLTSIRQTAVDESLRKLQEKETEFNELKVKYGVLEDQALQEKEEAHKVINELEISHKKLLEMEIVERKLKILITELEGVVAVERDKLKEIVDQQTIKHNEMQDSYESKMSELHKNLKDTENKLQEGEASRVEIMNSLEEKNKLIEKQKQEVDLYQNQARELMCQVTDIGMNLQRTQNEKTDLEKRFQEKNVELSQFQYEIETITMEKCALTKEVTQLKETLKKEAKERMELSSDLTRCKIQLQETMNSNNDMNRRLHRSNENSECEVKNLQTQIVNLKQKLDQVLMEKNVEIQNRNKLEEKFGNEMKIQSEKYEKCLVDLEKLSKLMENKTNQDSSIESALSSVTMEKEKLQKKFSTEKEKIEEKFKKSEELLSKKSETEKDLKKKLTKLQTDLKTAEKKYKDLESAKNNKILTLEKKLSNLGLSTVSQTTPITQTRGNTAKTSKNIHIKKDEIITTGKVRSILKPLGNSYSPKLSPKASPKKISFNFGSDSSDDLNTHENSILSIDDKFDDLTRSRSHLSITQLSASQLSNQETPKSNKFFKSRGNS